MPLVDASLVEGTIEGFSWYKLMLEIIADRATEEDCINCTLELASTYAVDSTVQLRFFGKDKLVQGPYLSLMC